MLSPERVERVELHGLDHVPVVHISVEMNSGEACPSEGVLTIVGASGVQDGLLSCQRWVLLKFGVVFMIGIHYTCHS